MTGGIDSEGPCADAAQAGVGSLSRTR